jgi:hypothetical protein
MSEVQQALRAAIEKPWGGSLTPALALRQAERDLAPLLAEDR